MTQEVITRFPNYGAVVTPNDTTDLPNPGYIRADEEGQVKVVPVGMLPADAITLNLAAGAFCPCKVSRVYDTDTDDITLHVFY